MQITRIVRKFAHILSIQQKMRIIQLIILMVIGGILEMLSVSLILPFMNAVMEPEETMGKWYARWFCELLDLYSSRTFLIVVSFLLAIIYIFKNAYLIIENNIQYRFVYGNMFLVQSRLLNSFLHRSYEDYLSVNSGEIIRIVSSDTQQAFSLLTTLLLFFTEFIVSIILIATVFVIAPAITICMAIILGILVLAINLLLKPALRKAGVQNQTASAGMTKWLLQSIEGVKELIVMQKADYFQANFDKYGAERVVSLRKSQIYGIAPRYLIEAASMSAMFMVVGVMIYSGKSIESMIPVLTAVAMAALRLLPSVNRMSSALASISYSEPMLDKLIENLKNMQGDNDAPFNPLNMMENQDKKYINGGLSGMRDRIEMRGVSYSYPANDREVLSKADLIIRSGESVGLVGATGAGKTTAVDIMLGLLRTRSGQVLVDGVDIREDMTGWLSQVGYIPQTIFMLDGSVRDNIAFGMEPELVSDEDVWKAVREASLYDFVYELPDGLDTRIGERGIRLSGGQRQRIGIARALYLNSSVLIFDEATSALDNETEKAIMDSINHLHGKKTMIIIAHRLTTIGACDHVYRVEHGKIHMER